MPKYKVIVDLDLCQGHSVCMSEAPDIFFVDEENDMYPKVKVLMDVVPESKKKELENAAKFCPNRVIRFEEIPD